MDTINTIGRGLRTSKEPGISKTDKSPNYTVPIWSKESFMMEVIDENGKPVKIRTI